MAEPTSLKFDIILNDAAFKTQVEADINLAKRLNETVTNSLNMGSITKATEATAKASTQAASAAKENAKAQQTAQAAIEKSAKSLNGGGNSLNRAWLRFSATVFSVISAIRLFTRTIGAAIKNIANFQQANANLATIMQVSRGEIEVLTNDALMLGRTTEWTASQVTELQTALAKLGYNIPQIRNMQASVLQFATAVGAKLPEAANLAGASLRMFGLRSSEMQRTLEILTASTNKTALDFEKLKVSLPYVGAIAHSIGLDIAQTASLLGVLTNAGLESSRAGTGLRQVLLELSKTNGKLQTAMGGNIKSFDDFVNGLEKMRDRGLQAGEATKLVSTRASSALLILANGVDDIKRLNNEVRESEGLLKTIQSERLDTLHGSVLLLKSAWEGLIQTFRDSAGPMKDIVLWLRDIINATSLAASRANRVAQGTKDVMGSDEITNRFKQRFEQLLDDEKTPEEAAKIVQGEMNKWLESAYGDLARQIRSGYSESNLNKFLYNLSPATRWLVSDKMKKGRAANEQVEAIENSIDALNDYMTNRSKEEGEIAANNFLEKWKATFDAEGAAAARAAMAKVAGYESIKEQVERYIAEGGAAGANNRGAGKTKEEEQRELIAGLKAESAYLRKLYDDYKKLEPYLGAEGAAAKMASIFGEGDYSEKNIEQGILAITDALRGMGAEGKEAAEEIERSMGLDEFSRAFKRIQNEKKAAEDAQKALDKYNETLRRWQSEDFNLSGTGFEYDINKVFTDLNTNLGKVDEKYIQAVKEAEEAHKGDAEAIAIEVEELQRLRDAEKGYVRAKAQESLNDLAESYLKDEYFLRGINLDHLGEKSIAQLSNLKKELNEIGEEARKTYSEYYPMLENFIQSLGYDIQELTEEDFEELRKVLPEAELDAVKYIATVKKLGLTFDVLQEKIQSAIKKGLKNLDEEEKKSIIKLGKYAAKQILELADAFKELGEALGNAGLVGAANSISEIADVAKSAMEGFSQGGWIGAVIGGVISVAKKFVDARTEAEKFKNSLIEIQEEVRHTAAISSLSVENIFGENSLEQIRRAKKLLEETQQKIGEIAGVKISRGRPQAETGILAAMRRHGLDLYDENGIINKESLEAMKKLYPDDTRWQKAIDLVDEYYAALGEIEEVSEAIVGSVVSSLVDEIVDSWWEAGEAALDYKDILGDVAKGYAKLIVQESLMKAAFDDERQKAFIEALKKGDAGEAMSIVEGAMQAAVDMLPTINDALQVLEPYRLMASEGLESNSVGSGIKSITEETANLLASYINAIRDDVSTIRKLQDSVFGGLQDFGEAIPTLNDYLNQIQANTYDTAQNTQSILSELRSVIGSPGTTGMVVRVESY